CDSAIRCSSALLPIVPIAQPTQRAAQVPHFEFQSAAAAARIVSAGSHFLTLQYTRAAIQNPVLHTRTAGVTLYSAVVLSVLTSVSQRGSKVTVSLYALELGAGSLAVGILAALFATFPLLLAVHAGRVSDRFGVRYPMLFGGLTMAFALALPIVFPTLNSLFACAALLGLGQIFFHVSVHNLIGTLGPDDERTH